jgi:hypothetical protein
MPATGGTIICKAISACLDIVLLSELSPYSWIKHPKKSTSYKPTALLEHLVEASTDLSRDLKKEFFLAQLSIAIKHSMHIGKSLFLRDHSFTTFNPRSQSSLFLEILDENNYSVRSLLTVRHPLDSYISSLNAGWVQRLSPDNQLDTYAKQLTVFSRHILQRSDSTFIRYEDFVSKPLDELATVGKHFGKSVDEKALDLAFAVPATGFSGRKGLKIEPRTRRPVLAEISSQASKSKSYQEYCSLFQYDPDPSSPQFTL